MKKLLIAALMGCAAMPAQAIDYIRIEGWGTVTGTYQGYAPFGYVSGSYVGSAYFEVICSRTAPCQSAQLVTNIDANSLEFRTLNSPVLQPNRVSLGFDYDLMGQLPLRAEGFIGGSIAGMSSSIMGIPAMQSLAAPGTGRIDRINVTTFSSDENISRSLFVRINAVPEPATWAMMIAGFGLAGAALRKRKPAIQFA